MTRIPIPKPSFLDNCDKVRWNRWRSKDRRFLYEWDSLHGEIEVYDKRGTHIGVIDIKGKPIKEAVDGRRIDV